MQYKEYVNKLNHPKWQAKRLEIMKRDGFKCSHCGTSDKKLHVHHGYYLKDKDPWDYEDDTLHTLCDSCHNKAHKAYDELKILLGRMSLKQLRSTIKEIKLTEDLIKSLG